MLIVDMPSPFGKDGYPNCNTCELRFYCQKPELIDCPIKGEVVRCRDCKWFAEFTSNGKTMGFGSCNNPQNIMSKCPQIDWFCADGERKEQRDG